MEFQFPLSRDMLQGADREATRAGIDATRGASILQQAHLSRPRVGTHLYRPTPHVVQFQLPSSTGGMLFPVPLHTGPAPTAKAKSSIDACEQQVEC